jgi:Rad4 beta-hairpin domain 1
MLRVHAHKGRSGVQVTAMAAQLTAPDATAAQLAPAAAPAPPPEATAEPAAPAHGAAATGAERTQRLAQLAESREEAELEQRALRERAELPKTIEGFKRSTVYLLERHITRYQGLEPGAKRLGLHKGESYYDRKSVSDLHSADRWRREGWQVLAWEIGNPAKAVKPRGAKDGGKGARAAAAGPAPPAEACFLSVSCNARAPAVTSHHAVRIANTAERCVRPWQVIVYMLIKARLPKIITLHLAVDSSYPSAQRCRRVTSRS